eukprot:gene222-99_t
MRGGVANTSAPASRPLPMPGAVPGGATTLCHPVPENHPVGGVTRGDLLIKTVLWKYYTQGVCNLSSEACRFAHGTSELRRKPKVNSETLCQSFNASGFCDAGAQCPYLHMRNEVRASGEEPCKLFAAGMCKNGEFCRFLHARFVDYKGATITLTPDVLCLLPLDSVQAGGSAAGTGCTFLIEDPFLTLGKHVPPEYALTQLQPDSTKRYSRRYFHNPGKSGALMVVEFPPKDRQDACPRTMAPGTRLVPAPAQSHVIYTSLHTNSGGGSAIPSRVLDRGGGSASETAQSAASAGFCHSGADGGRGWRSSDAGRDTTATRASFHSLSDSTAVHGERSKRKTEQREIDRVATWFIHRLNAGDSACKEECAQRGPMGLRSVSKATFKKFCKAGETREAMKSRERAGQMVREAIHRAGDTLHRQELSVFLFRVIASFDEQRNTRDALVDDAAKEAVLIGAKENTKRSGAGKGFKLLEAGPENDRGLQKKET